MKLTNLRRRQELIWILEDLSDSDYQKDYWLGNKKNVNRIDDFDSSVHFLFDDTLLAEDVEKEIGNCLRDENEANAVQSVCDTIDLIFDKYGMSETDRHYIECEEWSSVLNAAAHALKLIAGKDYQPSNRGKRIFSDNKA
ncbi:MAG: SCO4402 family protein [Endozoicomonas sp.]|uniref:SCO4402 family protein n=1 Tax=Endozoicomonas sp. TaxID=1892382 RepID=UPI003D9BD143